MAAIMAKASITSETAKNEFGLDHNETRSWHGWHRHERPNSGRKPGSPNKAPPERLLRIWSAEFGQ
jgi:hypothetical protein